MVIVYIVCIYVISLFPLFSFFLIRVVRGAPFQRGYRGRRREASEVVQGRFLSVVEGATCRASRPYVARQNVTHTHTHVTMMSLFETCSDSDVRNLLLVAFKASSYFRLKNEQMLSPSPSLF